MEDPLGGHDVALHDVVARFQMHGRFGAPSWRCQRYTAHGTELAEPLRQSCAEAADEFFLGNLTRGEAVIVLLEHARHIAVLREVDVLRQFPQHHEVRLLAFVAHPEGRPAGTQLRRCVEGKVLHPNFDDSRGGLCRARIGDRGCRLIGGRLAGEQGDGDENDDGTGRQGSLAQRKNS